MPQLYIGLMSGTSADGIDATLIEIDQNDQTKLLGHLETPHSEETRQAILSLCQRGENEIERLGQLDHQLGLSFAQAALQLLDQLNLSPSQVIAIGSHGQTIRHQPKGSLPYPFTLQIGDPNRIAAMTGITTVADFRRRDMAVGGEGAPLAPAFHQAAFWSEQEKRVIINIGGIANITDLTSSKNASPAGFDAGPGNALMDGWIKRHQNQNYDANGQWALSGKVHSALLAQLLSHRYFKELPPKSTGREDFHLAWLDQQLTSLSTHISNPIAAQDVQATLLELTAVSLIEAINTHAPDYERLYICGGGALNTALMDRLSQLAAAGESTKEADSARVFSTAALGIDPQQVEGAAFAWLAKQALRQLPGNSPAATGADRAVVLGGVYPA